MKEKTKKYLPFILGGGVLLIIGLYFLWPKSLEELEERDRLSYIENTADQGQDAPVAPSALMDLSVKALKQSDKGVDTRSDFLLKTTAPVDQNDLLRYLSVKTGEKFELSQNSDQEFTLSFLDDLQEDTLYNLVYSPPDKQPASYAFQTEKGFGIVGTVPRNEAANIPLNTGVEIYFNDKVDLNFMEFFSIEPEVKGAFEVMENRMIFQPDHGLDYDTVYTVTMKAGLTSLNKEQLAKDYTFTFTTQWENYTGTRFTTFGRAYEAFLPSDTIFFQVSVEDALADGVFEVDIFSVHDPMDYIAACNYSDLSVTIPENVSVFRSFETDVVDVPGEHFRYDRKYIFFDEDLPLGYYIAEIRTTYDGETFITRQCFQITELSVYSLSVEGGLCFWINNAATGSAAQGAVVRMDGKEFTADDQGLILLENGQKASSVISVSFGDGPAYVYRTDTFAPHEMEPKELYYTYLYTDRGAYRPTDTIDVFGIVRPVYKDYPVPPEAEITLSLGNMKSIPITLDSYGTFAVNIPISELRGFVYLTLNMGGEPLYETYVQCLEYAKGRYIFEAKAEKPVYFNGDEAAFTLNLSTYDGAPVEGAAITANLIDSLITDEMGAAVYETIVKQQPMESSTPIGAPYRENYHFTLSGQEEYMESASARVMVLQSDVIIEQEKMPDGGYTFTTSKIDVSALEAALLAAGPDEGTPDCEAYRGEPIDMEFFIEVYKKVYTKIETGSRYDYIKKTMVPTYENSQEYVFVDTFRYTTTDGAVTVTDLPASDNPMEYYEGKILFTDTRGTELSYLIPLDPESRFRFGGDDPSYNFYLERDTHDEYAWDYALGLGEKGIIHIEDMTQDQGAVYEGEMILIVSKNEILDVIIGDPMGIPLIFKEDYMGGVALFGGYYDGQHMYPVYFPFTLSYDYYERELNLAFKNDKEKYKPGDTVTTTINVTDINGKPKKALVNLSAVDEGAFAQYSNNPYALSYFYNSAYSSVYPFYVHSSNTKLDYSEDGNFGGAEKGGGGEDFALRDDFVENPVFLSVESDKLGTAVFQYDLPDNITSWRLTAHAISNDNYIGDSKSNIISTLPYYIDFVMLREFVAGDDLSIVVKPGGEAFSPGGSHARHSLEVSKDGKVVYRDSKSAAHAVTFIIPEVEAGEYTVLVKSRYGSYSDAMEETVTVAESSLLVPAVHEEKLTEQNPGLSHIAALSSPVNLSFSNGDMELLMNILYSVRFWDSQRTDEQAATAFTNYYLAQLRDSTISEETYLNQIRNSLRWYMGVPELTYGAPDLAYTARFAGTFPETIQRDQLLQYVLEQVELYEITDTSFRGKPTAESDNAYDEMNRAAGYFALAAAGENVLMEIYDQVALITNNTAQDIFTTDYNQQMRVLYYAAALCALGDDTGAYQLIQAYSPGEMENKEQNEYIGTLRLYINASVDPITAYNYLDNKEDNQYVSDVLEKIQFVRKVMPKTATAAAFTYELDGKTVRKELNQFDVHTLDITREQLADLNLTQIAGSTIVRAEYNTSPENLDPANQTIEIEKYMAENKSAGDGNRYTVDFTITLPKDAPMGTYTIIDRIPSNMRFANKTQNDPPYPYNRDGQTVVIHIYHTEKSTLTKRASYDVVQVADSNAVIGPAFVKGWGGNGLWGMSE